MQRPQFVGGGAGSGARSPECTRAPPRAGGTRGAGEGPHPPDQPRSSPRPPVGSRPPYPSCSPTLVWKRCEQRPEDRTLPESSSLRLQCPAGGQALEWQMEGHPLPCPVLLVTSLPSAELGSRVPEAEAWPLLPAEPSHPRPGLRWRLMAAGLVPLRAEPPCGPRWGLSRPRSCCGERRGVRLPHTPPGPALPLCSGGSWRAGTRGRGHGAATRCALPPSRHAGRLLSLSTRKQAQEGREVDVHCLGPPSPAFPGALRDVPMQRGPSWARWRPCSGPTSAGHSWN